MPTFSKARTEILLLQENVKKAEYKWGGKASYKCLMIIRHLSKKMVGVNIIKNQKSVYFSSVINSHCHKSCLLFSIENSDLNPSQSKCTEAIFTFLC